MAREQRHVANKLLHVSGELLTLDRQLPDHSRQLVHQVREYLHVPNKLLQHFLLLGRETHKLVKMSFPLVKVSRQLFFCLKNTGVLLDYSWMMAGDIAAFLHTLHPGSGMFRLHFVRQVAGL